MQLKLLNIGPAYLLIIFVIVANNLLAQKISPLKYKFGNITIEDFTPKIYSIDSNAQAVVLFDKGASTYESDNADWFNVVYVYHKKIRILNKNQFDLATIQHTIFCKRKPY